MSDLVCENHTLLLVMSRFGLALGFGDKSVKEICERNGVDTNTFLSVVNFLEDEQYLTENNFECVSIEALICYLQNAHAYFLDFRFPEMRRKLINAIDCSENDVTFLILKFYDEYVNEVRKHMEYEDKVVFKYVFSLLKGEPHPHYNVSIFAKKHDQIDAKLTELKNILVKYYPVKECNNLLNSVLFDIFSCEKDLAEHSKVEDYMFVPVVAGLEKKFPDNDK